MLTAEEAPYTTDNEEFKMDVADVDMTKWTEAEFQEKCTYIVKDHSWEGPLENAELTCAEASLPRNLAFKHPPDSTEVRLAWFNRNKFQRRQSVFDKLARTVTRLTRTSIHQRTM